MAHAEQGERGQGTQAAFLNPCPNVTSDERRRAPGARCRPRLDHRGWHDRHHHDWLGKLGFGGIVDGEHFFIVDRNADGSTHLTHGKRYSGALVALTKPFLNKERNQAGHGSFNRVLKQRVENLQKEQ